MDIVPRQPVEPADNSRGKVTTGDAIKTLIGAAVFLVVLYLVLGWLGVLISNTIPDGWEKKLSTASILEQSHGGTLERPQRILDRLMQGKDLRDLNYRLFWLSMDVPNAVAVPGGGIGVSPSLLNSVESDIGLAFVLAHELGHHQSRHILRGLGRQLTLSLALAVTVGSDFNSLKAATQVADSTYSRHHEREADDFGLRLVHEQFGTATGALEFFEDMQREGKEWRLQKYLGSHPLTKERLEDLRALQRELESPN